MTSKLASIALALAVGFTGLVCDGPGGVCCQRNHHDRPLSGPSGLQGAPS